MISPGLSTEATCTGISTAGPAEIAIPEQQGHLPRDVHVQVAAEVEADRARGTERHGQVILVFEKHRVPAEVVLRETDRLHGSAQPLNTQASGKRDVDAACGPRAHDAVQAEGRLCDRPRRVGPGGRLVHRHRYRLIVGRGTADVIQRDVVGPVRPFQVGRLAIEDQLQAGVASEEQVRPRLEADIGLTIERHGLRGMARIVATVQEKRRGIGRDDAPAGYRLSRGDCAPEFNARLLDRAAR